jgi:predicted secreted Zn-dependent protease
MRLGTASDLPLVGRFLALLLGTSLLLLSAFNPKALAAEDGYDAALQRLREVPGVEISRYLIRGATAAALREQLDSNGPVDWDGKRGDAYTHWNVVWRWQISQDGRPSFQSPFIHTSIRVTLPRWEPPPNTQRQLVESWHKFMRALIEHEILHAQNAAQIGAKITEQIGARVKSSPELELSEANSIAKAAIDSARAWDRELDHETKHGKTQGVRFP